MHSALSSKTHAPAGTAQVMGTPFVWVDAFTQSVFGGNPAAVCALETWLPDDRMQTMARQHGLSETAFLVRQPDGRWHIRWFTPAHEVDLCGHATLASAHVLFTQLSPKLQTVTFASRSGDLHVKRLDDGRLELDFPALDVTPVSNPTLTAALATALGVTPTQVFRTRDDLLAVFENAAQVRALAPQMAQVAALDARAVMATAPGDDGADFVSRFFAPRFGIPEDAVTGSAHCALAPLWAARLGRTQLVARQLSARGGQLWCDVRGPRVGIAGHAVTYLTGNVTF